MRSAAGTASTGSPAVSAPPWSRRNGGYSSRISKTYAATRATQRSRPSTTSKIPRGYRVVKSRATPAKKTRTPISPVW